MRADRGGGYFGVSRNEMFYEDYKRQFEEMGFENVKVTGLESDALDMLIDKMKPRIVIIGANFYKSALTYMTGRLLRRHKGINIAVVVVETFPADIAMTCVVNGVNSYVTIFDGVKQFKDGLECMKKGKCFISPSVIRKMANRDLLPEPSVDVTQRELEILRFLRHGFTGFEIAEELGISRDTVNFHKKEMYQKFGVRNEKGLLLAAEDAGYELKTDKRFYPRNYELKPKTRRW